LPYSTLGKPCRSARGYLHAVLSANVYSVLGAQLQDWSERSVGSCESVTCSFAGLSSAVVTRPLVDERDTASADGAVNVGAVKLITPVRVGSRSLWAVRVKRGTSLSTFARAIADSALNVL
jgi:hypothetical protein